MFHRLGTSMQPLMPVVALFRVTKLVLVTADVNAQHTFKWGSTACVCTQCHVCMRAHGMTFHGRCHNILTAVWQISVCKDALFTFLSYSVLTKHKHLFTMPKQKECTYRLGLSTWWTAWHLCCDVSEAGSSHSWMTLPYTDLNLLSWEVDILIAATISYHPVCWTCL